MISNLKSKLLSASLIACVSSVVLAQALPEAMVSAARKAVLSNPEVQARWNGFNAADNERQVARGGFFPQIDITANVGRENRETPVADYGTYNYNTAQITLNQMLFDGFFTSSETKRLGIAKLTRYYELLEVAETTALEAVRAYADVLRYRELVDAATQNYVEHKQSAQLVEERSKSGVGRGVDLEQTKGRLALAEYNQSARCQRTLFARGRGKAPGHPALPTRAIQVGHHARFTRGIDARRPAKQPYPQRRGGKRALLQGGH